ncbi:hypothetical protein PMI08_00420 [Brevibacillus sp. CF112]|nr:hypothetical protein PMI08_00420 [Brevibacillus sp. CF112]
MQLCILFITLLFMTDPPFRKIFVFQIIHSELYH